MGAMISAACHQVIFFAIARSMAVFE